MTDIAKRAKEARTLKVDIEGREFVLIVPTRFQFRQILLAHGNPDLEDRATLLKLHRSSLLEAVVGWTGVLDSDVVGGDQHEVLPFSRASAIALFDERDEWADQLQDKLMERNMELAARFVSAAKN